MGTTKHSDGDFLSVLLQDHIGGLQVLHENQWVDIPPTPGALVINIGDLLQASLYSLALLVILLGIPDIKRCFYKCGASSTGKFCRTKSISGMLFHHISSARLSEENTPNYRETTVREYVLYFNAKGLDGTSALLHYKL
ncbi:hypothetical protein REPUB_Repub20aG0099700 [Reevesia pubescens]